MRINTMPKLVLTGTNPAFYDMDSKTAVEQTAKLYAKVQEIIDACNDFSDALQKEVDDFTSNQSYDYENYKNGLNKIMHEFIHSIDTKVDTAVHYMTENLSGAVESMSSELIESLVNEKVGESLGSYETRLTTLENVEYSLVHDEVTESLTLVKGVKEVSE